MISVTGIIHNKMYVFRYKNKWHSVMFEPTSVLPEFWEADWFKLMSEQTK